MNLLKKLSLAIKLHLLESKNNYFESAKSNVFLYLTPIFIAIVLYMYITLVNTLLGDFFVFNLGNKDILKLLSSIIILTSIVHVLLLKLFYKDTPISPLTSILSPRERYLFNSIQTVYIQTIFTIIIFYPIFLMLSNIFTILYASIIYFIIIIFIEITAIYLHIITLQIKFFKSKLNILDSDNHLYNGLLRMPFFGLEIILLFFIQIISIFIIKLYPQSILNYILMQIIYLFPYFILFFGILLQSIYISIHNIILSFPKAKKYLLIFHLFTLIILMLLFIVSIGLNTFVYTLPIYSMLFDGLTILLLIYSISKFIPILHSNQFLIFFTGILIIFLNSYISQIIPNMYVKFLLAILVLLFSIRTTYNSLYDQ